MNYFDEYIKNYDLTIPELEYKYHHSYRVMDNIVTLAKSMNLPMKDVELAECIGILHDIGRFEQFKLYHNFKDVNMDHGDFGEKLLRENNILDNFDIDKKDYEVVYLAIRNHNKLNIEDNLDERTLLFSKMIRDADKMDIFYAMSDPKINWILPEDDEDISARVRDAFFNNCQTKRSGQESKNEHIVIMLSYIYDMNYNISLDIIKNNEYLEKSYQKLKHKKIFKPYYEHLKKYIDERTR